MEKVTIDYNRLCLELEKQGKTKADLSRDMQIPFSLRK